MALDLRLLPFDHDSVVLSFAHSLLSCYRSGIAQELLYVNEHHGRPVPEGFCSFVSRRSDGESGYGKTHTTPYGEPLQWVEVRHLKPFKEHPSVQGYRRNRAIWAYLSELADDTKVALYFH